MSRAGFLVFAVCSVAASLCGCANSAVISSALQRAAANDDQLAKEQAKTSEFLARSLSENQRLVQILITVLDGDCARSNQGISTYLQVRKEAAAYRLKAEFDEAAYGVLDEFTDRFNTQFAPLEAQTTELGKELAALQAPEFGDDLGRAVKVSEKKREMLGNALFQAQSNVRLRDKLIARIGTERSRLFAVIDARIAAIQAPTEDCEALTRDFETVGSQLTNRVKAATDHQSAVADLHAAQRAELGVITQYTNRMAFYRLVIAGAGDAVRDKVVGLSDRLTDTLAGADARVDTFIDHAQSRFFGAVDKFSGDLNSTAASLQTDVAAAVNRSRGATSETHPSGKPAVSKPDAE